MLEERIARFAPRQSKGISYREAGAGPALVLLHGIGSSAASWLFPFETLQGYRLIAWDAPGYGEADFFAPPTPRPAAFAPGLREIDELGPAGLAEKRAPTLVAAGSPPIALELVRWSQGRVRPQGYRQALH